MLSYILKSSSNLNVLLNFPFFFKFLNGKEKITIIYFNFRRNVVSFVIKTHKTDYKTTLLPLLYWNRIYNWLISVCYSTHIKIKCCQWASILHNYHRDNRFILYFSSIRTMKDSSLVTICSKNSCYTHCMHQKLLHVNM